MSLVMSFALPSSCYATMLIRELLKVDTVVGEHKAASQRSKAQETAALIQAQGDPAAEHASEGVTVAAQADPAVQSEVTVGAQGR